MALRKLVPLFVLPLALAACSRPTAAPAAAAPTNAPPKVTGTGVVAEVNGGAILSSELEQRVSSRLARVRQEEYELRRQVLDEMIVERLVASEAQKRRISTEELLKQEVDRKAATPEDSYVDTIYEQNKLRFGSASKPEATARIRQILTQRAVADRRAAFEKDLRAGATVAVRLEAPRATFAIPAGAPATGPKEAPVTIVEFTDYQCPYCHSAQSTIDQVMSRYEGKVRLVHLDFPLDFHTEALPAARAARCAGEQGKFWEYHHSLMTQKGTLDPDDLKQRATSLKLGERAFGSCLGSTKHDQAIQAELQQGTDLGVTGTPAYFVNGRMLSGSRPLESFTEVIDSELSTAQGGAGGERR
jgi:protein-disulfide isomerase